MRSAKENDSSSRPMIVDSIFSLERDVTELKGANGNARRPNVA